MNKAEALAEAGRMLDENPVPQTDRILLHDGRMIAYRPSRETIASLQRQNQKYDIVMKRLANG